MNKINDNLYETIMNLTVTDLEKLREESKTEEEKNFYYKLQELIFRTQQEKIITEGVF